VVTARLQGLAEPKVFVSYSYDGPEHEAWVLQLASDLRKNGIDVSLAKWDLPLGGDVAAFMQDGTTKADRVIIVCSDNYVRKAGHPFLVGLSRKHRLLRYDARGNGLSD
jgi:hypothetical protein